MHVQCVRVVRVPWHMYVCSARGCRCCTHVFVHVCMHVCKFVPDGQNYHNNITDSSSKYVSTVLCILLCLMCLPGVGKTYAKS